MRQVHQDKSKCPNAYWEPSRSKLVCPCLTQAEWEAFLEEDAKRANARVRT